jgi:phage N-6-adenine-methyltransferase
MTTTWHRRPAAPVEKPAGWSSDQWATPWSLVRALEAELGPFDLDPAAEHQTAKAPRFYTIKDDGLTRPWFGRVWLNPPYSKPRPWLDRAREATSTGEAELVTALLPASVDTRWFHEAVLPYAELRFIRGRVRFLGWEGTPIPSPKAPSLLAIYRSAALEELAMARNHCVCNNPADLERRLIVARALAAEHGMPLGAHDEEDQLEWDRKACQVLRDLAAVESTEVESRLSRVEGLLIEAGVREERHHADCEVGTRQSCACTCGVESLVSALAEVQDMLK